MALPTLIYTHGGGRVGNQVLRFAHWIAWVLANEGQVEVLNVAFWPYAEYFEQWRRSPACLFPQRHSVLGTIGASRTLLPSKLRGWVEAGYRVPRIIHGTGKWMPGWQDLALDDAAGESLDLAASAFVQRIRRRSVTTFAGWRVANWTQLREHADEVRMWLRPAVDKGGAATAFIAKLRLEHDVVIGVLMRQTDYRTWHGGRFFHADSAYVRWLRQLHDLYPSRRVAIVIAADEWHDPAQFAGLDVHFTPGAVNSGGHWFDSFVALSLCDLVLSVPSTFSATAAFLGNVPLLPLTDGGQELSLSEVFHDPLADAAEHELFRFAVS